MRPLRIPITPPLLLTMGRTLWNSSYHFQDKSMLWAAMLTAFYGFLRVSEYTSPFVRQFDPSSTLCTSDIHLLSQNHAKLLIKASKTDPFRAGVHVSLYANKSPLCPIAAISKYLSQNPNRSGPLFSWHDGRYLTRAGLASVLERIKPQYLKNMSSHSFRIGAASTAAAAGYPRWLIQALGRWSSNCYKEYIRIPPSTLTEVSNSLASQTPIQCPVFDPDNIS